MNSKAVLLNDRIAANKVTVIDENGEKQGEMSISNAMSLASEKNLDLWQVSKDTIPICKLVDYGKMMYNKSKKNKQNKNTHKHHEAKEITFNYHIADHDLGVKNKKARKILSKGIKVIYSMDLVGRECKLTQDGLTRFNESLNGFEDIAEWDKHQVSSAKSKRRRTVRTISIVLRPKSK